MRGADTFTESSFTLHRLEDFVPPDHPLRPIRQMVNEELVKMDALFAGMYEADSKGGRPSIAPEKLLRAMLLQVFYSIRSERQLLLKSFCTNKIEGFFALSNSLVEIPGLEQYASAASKAMSAWLIGLESIHAARKSSGVDKSGWWS